MEEQAGCSFWDERAAAAAAAAIGAGAIGAGAIGAGAIGAGATEEGNTSNSSLMPPTPSIMSVVPQEPADTVAEEASSVSLCHDIPSEVQVPWHLIPDIVLEHILSFLSDVDRCHASLACTTWRRAFKNPSLWRRRYFVFRSFDAFDKVESYQKYLAHLGWHLQSMSLELSRPNINTASVIAKAFEQFINSLNKTFGVRLLQIRIVNADFHSGWHFFSPSRGTVVRSLCNLLKKQSFLRTVDLSYCLMDRDEGTRLLDALSYGTRLHPKVYLSDINLRQFFSPRTRAASLVRYGKVMGQFHSLATIRMDLRTVSQTIIERVTRASSRTLRYLELDFYADESVDTHAISSECWRGVSERLPNLRTKVRIHGLCGFQKYISVLVRGMPLSELRVTYLGVENLNDPALLTGIRSLIVYLADTFRCTLSKLHLQLRPDLDVSADTAVVRFVRNCVNLRELNVNLALQASTVVLILDIIHRQRAQQGPLPAKRTRFHLNVRGMTPELDRSIRLMALGGYSDVTARTLSAGTGTIAPAVAPLAAPAVFAAAPVDDDAPIDDADREQ